MIGETVLSAERERLAVNSNAEEAEALLLRAPEARVPVRGEPRACGPAGLQLRLVPFDEVPKVVVIALGMWWKVGPDGTWANTPIENLDFGNIPRDNVLRLDAVEVSSLQELRGAAFLREIGGLVAVARDAADQAVKHPPMNGGWLTTPSRQGAVTLAAT